MTRVISSEQFYLDDDHSFIWMLHFVFLLM